MLILNVVRNNRPGIAVNRLVCLACMKETWAKFYEIGGRYKNLPVKISYFAPHVVCFWPGEISDPHGRESGTETGILAT